MRRTQLVLSIACIAGLTLAGCSSKSSNSAAPAASVGPNTIVIQSFDFTEITVAKGTLVTVLNRDTAPHTVTEDSGKFTTSVDSHGTGSFRAPMTAGVYTFHCSVHASMPHKKLTVT